MKASAKGGPAPPRPYHHGDLRNGLRKAAREILEQEGIVALSLRAVARKAGVSHAAPYRHYANHGALLAELACDGFEELKSAIAAAAAAPGLREDRIASIGGAYMRFVVRQPALTQLMFGPQLPDRATFPALAEACEAIGTEIGTALGDPALGIAVWAAIHGLALLIVENVVDLGQRRSGSHVLPSRAEILLRSLFSSGPSTGSG